MTWGLFIHTYADGAANGRGKACAGLEANVERVLEALPFFVGEDAAPVGES